MTLLAAPTHRVGLYIAAADEVILKENVITDAADGLPSTMIIDSTHVTEFHPNGMPYE
jgi:hypothetical protein